MKDSGSFDAFTPEEFKADQSTIMQVMNSVDKLAPSDRDRKLSQQSTQILNYLTVQDLQTRFGFVNWLPLLRQVMDANIRPEDEVVVHYPDILQQIQTIVNISDKRILYNAILMLVVRDLLLELYKAPPGVEKWSFCLQAAKGGFGEIMSGLYLQQFSPDQLENHRVKVCQVLAVAFPFPSADRNVSTAEWKEKMNRPQQLTQIYWHHFHFPS